MRKAGKHESDDVAHHVNADTDMKSALLVAQAHIVRTPARTNQGVYLQQENVHPSEYDDGAWVLDTGATNHMTGCREAFADLDVSVRGSVRFGDGSTVICGVGAVTITGKNHEHRVLAEVYYIPSLRCNIFSLGQLEEAGCRVEIDKGVMEVFDREHEGVTRDVLIRVLIRAVRRNRLYIMKVNLSSPICLLSKMEEEAWRWHARFGHLNFRALRALGVNKMVDGLPRSRKLSRYAMDVLLASSIGVLFLRLRHIVLLTGLS